MIDYTAIQNAINIIGDRLVNCNHICQGVIHDCHKGILPRFLIWEERNEDESGCAVIGLNPGTASQEEMELYRLTPTYDQVVRFWKNESPRIQYYKLLHNFLNQFGIAGSI